MKKRAEDRIGGLDDIILDRLKAFALLCTVLIAIVGIILVQAYSQWMPVYLRPIAAIVVVGSIAWGLKRLYRRADRWMSGTRRRWAAGHCHACGYDTRGVPGKQCPECGALIADWQGLMEREAARNKEDMSS